MEKEIIVALSILILWQCILGMFMRNIMKKYIKIVKQYNYSEGENLSPEWKEKTAHLLKRAKILCVITFGSSSSKKLYNTLCYMLATTEFMDGNTDEFLRITNTAKRSFSNTYAMLSSVLALYYNAEGDREMAEKYYRSYLLCDHEKKNMQIVMQKLFSDTEVDETELKEAMQETRNPAIVKLLQDNRLMG